MSTPASSSAFSTGGVSSFTVRHHPPLPLVRPSLPPFLSLCYNHLSPRLPPPTPMLAFSKPPPSLSPSPSLPPALLQACVLFLLTTTSVFLLLLRLCFGTVSLPAIWARYEEKAKLEEAYARAYRRREDTIYHRDWAKVRVRREEGEEGGGGEEGGLEFRTPKYIVEENGSMKGAGPRCGREIEAEG